MTEPPRPPGESGSGDGTADPTAPYRPSANPEPAGTDDPSGGHPGGYAGSGTDHSPSAPHPPGQPGHPPAGEPGHPPGGYGGGAGYPPGGHGGYGAPGYPQGGHPGYPPGGPGGEPGYPPGGPGYPPGGPGYPPGGYGGYGPPGPAGYPTQEDRNWALIAHFGGPIGVVVGGGLLGWVAPLVAMMTRGQQSPIARAHAIAALNFQLTWAVASVLSWVATALTCGTLFFIPLLIWVVPVIFGIVGGVKANEGQLYRYPVTYPFVKR